MVVYLRRRRSSSVHNLPVGRLNQCFVAADFSPRVSPFETLARVDEDLPTTSVLRSCRSLSSPVPGRVAGGGSFVRKSVGGGHKVRGGPADNGVRRGGTGTVGGGPGLSTNRKETESKG